MFSFVYSWNVITGYLRKLTAMTSLKTGIGLLYTKYDAVICKELKAELTNKCPDIEVRADVAVDTRRKLILLVQFNLRKFFWTFCSGNR